MSEFFKYITSQQGQTRIAEDAKYVPLNRESALKQWEILEESKAKGVQYFKDSAMTIEVNGTPVETDVHATDFIGTVMLPVEPIIQALGGVCSYDEEGYALPVALGDHICTVRHGNVKTMADDKLIRLEKPAFKVEDVMVAPAAFFTDVLNIPVVLTADSVIIG